MTITPTTNLREHTPRLDRYFDTRIDDTAFHQHLLIDTKLDFTNKFSIIIYIIFHDPISEIFIIIIIIIIFIIFIVVKVIKQFTLFLYTFQPLLLLILLTLTGNEQRMTSSLLLLIFTAQTTSHNLTITFLQHNNIIIIPQNQTILSSS
jgi:hypothetical protein